MIVNSDHAGEITTSHSCTDFMIFLNLELNNWILKKPPTVEISFVWIQICCHKAPGGNTLIYLVQT